MFFRDFRGSMALFLLGGAILELWKDIPGYEGLYQVSDTGKVRSMNWRNRGVVKELTLKENQQGEFLVELSQDGKRKTHSVQALMEEAFPPGEPVEEPMSEPAETPIEEEIPETPAVAIVEEKTPEVETAEEPPRPAGKPIWQMSLYGEPVKRWDDITQIRKEFGYQPGTIFECCQCKQKSAYGFKWQFASEYEGRSS